MARSVCVTIRTSLSLAVVSVAIVWSCGGLSHVVSGMHEEIGEQDKRSMGLLDNYYYPQLHTQHTRSGDGQQFWKRLVSSLYADEQQAHPRFAQRAYEVEDASPEEVAEEEEAEGEDADVKRAAHMADFERHMMGGQEYPVDKRGRHVMNCQRFKTFGQGYSGLC